MSKTPVATTTVITLLNWKNPHARAVLGMGWGLISLWIFLGGTLMYRFRAPIRVAVMSIPLDWRLKFVLCATVLVPFLFIPLVPLALVAHLLSPHHPRIHFPPISG